jgi:hypothetical protein
MLSLPQGPLEKHCSAVPHPVHGHPSAEMLPKRLTEYFLECISVSGEKTKPQRKCEVHKKGIGETWFPGLTLKTLLNRDLYCDK